ncbi:hypothetical protein [Massilia sp. YIM B02443]|uniref:hypothetical protein n=1 Tax=Massilia sp. YIM B02443 TaxID=3050127 RepID=UPI0025B6CBDC|nr:hypothetical protein [Massilia sp. YIM B02443]MDN4035596.1 hypothetical protein [Massilia sp. YIM B02443]
MDFRTAYTRRLEKASRRQKRFGTLVVFGVTAGVAALLVPELVGAHDERHAAVGTAPAPAAAPVPAAATPQQAAAPRRVYPYSIIPGGVSGVAELKRVIRADKVVAAHYADFDADKAQEVTVTRPRAVHVSYRKGDQVFWTAKKVMLAQGETLLSDGSNEMRARCANRISDVPRFPVEAHGPSEEELDTVLASATGEEGMFLAASAGSVAEAGGSGSRYPLGYFPDGAGLVQPASSLASMRAGMASVPQADRSALYDLSTGNRIGRMAQSSASEGDAGATPSAGASGGGTTGSGSGGDSAQPSGGGDTPATGGGTTPADGDPSATPGTGSGGAGGDGGAGGPATGGNGGNGGTGTGGAGNGNGGPGGGGSGSGNQPSTPVPEAGPELPPQGPATPGAPQPSTPGDVDLPAAPVELPEPGTLWLSGAAIAAMLWLRRQGRRARH